MTITEKILAKASGKKQVKPGDNIWVDTDILFTHDVCGPGTIGVFYDEFGQKTKVFDKEKVVLIPDHYIFTKDKKSLRNIETLKQFAEEQDIRYFYPPHTSLYKGVCHVALPEEGHILPGTVVFGTDSHTCTHGALGAFATGIGNTDAAFIMGTGKLLIKVPETLRFNIAGRKPDYLMAKDIILKIIGDIGTDGATYCAMEFEGSAITELSIEERMTLCNMVVEAGAKNGIIAPDDKTLNYVKQRTNKAISPVYSDNQTAVRQDFNYDVAEIEPGIAKPHSPGNYALAKDLHNQKIDRAYIGSCTGGKLEDFKAAASILYGRKAIIDVFLVPATTTVAEGLNIEKIQGKTLSRIFKEAGCLDIAPPSCAACLGGPPDTFGRTVGNERVISTTNRNFPGRMGSRDSAVFLASPLTAAASAVTGRITDPREFI
jgi:3-isopropylmalate/(R)-2-methylmalate dehydratase large subunit